MLLAWTLAGALAGAFAPIALHAELDIDAPPAASPVDKALLSLANKPKPALVELRKLYDRYAALVEAKRDDGWQYALLSGDIAAGKDNVMPARQLEEAAAKRAAELNAAKAKLAGKADLPDAAKEDLQLEIERRSSAARSAARRAAREKGTCIDWSDEVWFELRKLSPEEWSVADTTREARPRHTAAVLCTPADDPKLCLAFDPWQRGEPDVYELDSWNAGSLEGRLPAEFFLHHLPGR